MISDMRRKEELTYEEALHHLWRLLNADTYRKITDAIRKEIEDQKTAAVREELAHQEYSSNFV